MQDAGTSSVQLPFTPSGRCCRRQLFSRGHVLRTDQMQFLIDESTRGEETMARCGSTCPAGGLVRGLRIGVALGAIAGVAMAMFLPVVVLAAITVGATIWLAGRTRSALGIDSADVSCGRRRLDV